MLERRKCCTVLYCTGVHSEPSLPEVQAFACLLSLGRPAVHRRHECSYVLFLVFVCRCFFLSCLGCATTQMSEKMELSEKQAEEGLVDEAQALLAEASAFPPPPPLPLTDNVCTGKNAALFFYLRMHVLTFSEVGRFFGVSRPLP